MKKNYIAIIDYQLSNLFSVKHALDHLGMECVITSKKRQIAEASGAILPGMGAFGDAMANLRKMGLIDVIQTHIEAKKPFMGVCLGFQLLFDESEEFGRHQGLGVIKGKVKRFPETNKKGQSLIVPHIGWNSIFYDTASKSAWRSSPLQALKNHEYMYFVHSFYVQPSSKKMTSSYTDYQGFQFCSSVSEKNIFGTQFHPEKSGERGIQLYKHMFQALV